MTESYRALCTDFYVNQKLAVKLDLPRGRETVLELFERVRRQFPSMNSFRRFRDELALESPQSDLPQRWLAVRANTIRTGVVNASKPAVTYGRHRAVLDIAPVFMNISALDVDYLELLFGFDLAAAGNHDAIVFDALLSGSPLARLLEAPGASISDCQPMVGCALSIPENEGRGAGKQGIEAFFEVKTRENRQHAPPQSDGEPQAEPISVYLTLRRFGAVSDLKELPGILESLGRYGEEMIESRVGPALLLPLREAIGSGNP